MLDADYEDKFLKIFGKIKDNFTKEKTIKQLEKIRINPEIGKPMRYSKKRHKRSIS